MVVLADSSCDYCKGYIFVFVPGYVVGDFLQSNVKCLLFHKLFLLNVWYYINFLYLCNIKKEIK
uniref:Uncharacterized protein n=1 Tax=Siphoviridae sp. ctlwB1 TaxID=2826449 RepID=A0A8S5ND67_9CAUD|nr:MAG TPA: hypothetical protein [Siphoviridae sp. ctlwB1]